MGSAKRKSPPENMTAAAITRGAAVMDVAVGTRKSPPEMMAAGAITTDTAVMDVAVGTSARETGRVPSLPPFVVGPPQTHWICPRCKCELRITTKRCGNCKTWQGGKRGGAKTTKKQSKTTSKAVPDAQNKTPKNKLSTAQGRAAKYMKKKGRQLTHMGFKTLSIKKLTIYVGTNTKNFRVHYSKYMKKKGLQLTHMGFITLSIKNNTST
jgi:uncharacterized protein YdaU (DUF1376 family)